jgi:hypothetical protein
MIDINLSEEEQRKDDQELSIGQVYGPTGCSFLLLALASAVQKAEELTLAICRRAFWDRIRRQRAQGVSDNAWSSLRAAPKLPSW